MLKKRNLLFLSLLILSVLLLSSCFLNPSATEGILKGQVMVPEGTTQAKDLTGQALPDATVNIIDLSTGAIIATATTDATGHYQVSVPPGGPYLLEVVKGSVKLEQITCQVEVGIEYNLGTADCATTAAALIAQAMLDAEDYPNNLSDINLTNIETDPNFDDVSSIVCATIKVGQDPTVSAAIEQTVEDFLYPPAPAPTPTPEPAPTPLTAIGAITGTAKVGETLTAGALTPSAATADYQWQICATSDGTYANISGATSTTYTAVADDVTKFIKVVATGTGNYSGTVTSTATTAVTAVTSYTVTYDGNGNTGGTVPTDANNYQEGAVVTVLGNTGNLVKIQDEISLLFTGWNTATDGSGTSYNEAGTFNMGSANVTLYAQWSVIRGTGPAGGLIFYDDEADSVDNIPGVRYLEAAPASTEWEWKEWGSYKTEIGGTGKGIGTGQSNTTIIVNWLNENTDDTYGDVTDKAQRAAYLCDALVYGGYDDWFLPSKDELSWMYVVLHIEGDGGFAGIIYWSSSECDADYAWGLNFFATSWSTHDKEFSYPVRAVRAF